MAGPLLVVGSVARTHGLAGDVIVVLVTNRTERVAPGTELVTGDGRVLRVASSSPHGGRWRVHFDGVDSIDAATALRGATLRAEALDDAGELWVHQLVGAQVVDATGAVRGTVTGVQANPASDLLVLDTGALVPLRFVVDFVPGEQVTVDVPDGLFDLA